MGRRVLPSGECAVLVELDSLGQVLELHRRLWVQDRPEGLLDAVPGARTLLLVADSAAGLGGVRAACDRALAGIERVRADVSAEAGGPGSGPEVQVEVEVRYDGPDLHDVARLAGLTRSEVVAAHTGRPWIVGFAGFAPGFAYLVGGDPRLRVPRRETPRPRVPAGAVGLAGEFSGIYPRASPGGWQLIGTSDAALWDLRREPPALLRPGMLVRFVDIGGTG